MLQGRAGEVMPMRLGGRRVMVCAVLATVAMALTGGCAVREPAKPQSYAFWPAFPDEPRVQFLASYQRATDVEPNRGRMDDLIFGKEQLPDLPLVKPYGAPDVERADLRLRPPQRRRHVLDLRNHRTLVLGRTGASTMQTPTDIAIADDGTKYVADIGRGMIFVYDAQDRAAGVLGHKDLKPSGVAVRGDELYVCDFQTQKVEVWDRHSGQVLRTIGGPGGEPGQFIRPLGLAVDREGNVYVSDVMKCRLSRIRPSGQADHRAVGHVRQGRRAGAAQAHRRGWGRATSTSSIPPFRTCRSSTPQATC